MDTEQLLRELRAAILVASESRSTEARRIADIASQLDLALASGGALPTDWRNAERRSGVERRTGQPIPY